MRKTLRKCFDKRAVSPVISTIILTGVVIALSFVVLAWTQTRAEEYRKNYGQTADVEIARLKERLIVEYASYDRSSRSIQIYLLNCGAVDDVKLQTVHVRNATWHKVFAVSLKFFNGTSIPDQDLDIGEEGYFALSLSTDTLTTGAYYFVRIVTERGSLFDSGFVA